MAETAHRIFIPCTRERHGLCARVYRTLSDEGVWLQNVCTCTCHAAPPPPRAAATEEAEDEH